MFRIPIGPTIHSVKLNSLVLQYFHLAIEYNEVWGRGAYIILFQRVAIQKCFR